MNGFYVDTGYRNKKKEKKREVLEKEYDSYNNKNACVGVCLYFDNFFIIL